MRKEKWQTFGAHEAPANVDMTVVAVALLGVEVVGADDCSVCDHLAARSHTQVTDVVRDRAAQATHQPTFSTESNRDARLDRFTLLRNTSVKCLKSTKLGFILLGEGVKENLSLWSSRL